MPGIADLVRELHRLHKHIRGLKEEIDNGPKLIKTHQAKVARAENNLKEAHDKIKQLKVSALEKESALKANFQAISKHEKQRNEAGAKKEYDALQTEIANERKNCSALEEEILLVMAEVEEKTAGVPALEKTLQDLRNGASAFEKECQERLARWNAELQQTEAQLADAEKGIPGELRNVYDRLIQAHGADGLASVKDKTCMSCRKTITAQQQNQLEAGQFITCKSCGKVLYLQG
jgi:predicted  nucleic acid-binding Zn-ribbon protein